MNKMNYCKPSVYLSSIVTDKKKIFTLIMPDNELMILDVYGRNVWGLVWVG